MCFSTYSCFIGDVGIFFGAFLGPIFLIFVFDTVVFTTVITVLIKHTRRKFQRSEDKSKKTAVRLLISIVGIVNLFGLTWVFGALTVRAPSNVAFQYIFVIFNAFQGFFIFLFFCVLGNDGREFWTNLCKNRIKKKIATSSESHAGDRSKAGSDSTSGRTRSTSNISTSKITSLRLHYAAKKSDLSSVSESDTEFYTESNPRALELHHMDTLHEEESETTYTGEPKLDLARGSQQSSPHATHVLADMESYSELHSEGSLTESGIMTDDKESTGTPGMSPSPYSFSPARVASKPQSDASVIMKRESTLRHHVETAVLDMMHGDSSSDESDSEVLQNRHAS